MDDMVLQENWSGSNDVCNLLRTIWGTVYLNGHFEAKPQVYCIPKENERERDKTSLLKKRRAAEGTVRAPSPARAAVAVDRLQSGTIWSEEHSRDWKTENPWLDSWLCATRGWNSIRTPLVCTLVFFPLTLLSCFFFYKAKGLLVSGLWSRQGTFLRGAQAPFLDTSQCCTFFPPSLPWFPLSNHFSPTFPHRSTLFSYILWLSYLVSVRAHHPLLSWDACLRSSDSNPSRSSHSPLCHLTLPLLAFSITLLGFCLFGKDCWVFDVCRCLWFLPGSRGAQGESALCSDNVGLQGGSWDCFSAPTLLGRVFNRYRCTVLLPGERFGLGGRDYTWLDN